MSKLERTPNTPERDVFYPHARALVTCSDKAGRTDILTVEGLGGINRFPFELGICLHRRYYSTYRRMFETRAFVINIPDARLARAVSLCDEAMGRDDDKFALSGLTPAPATKVSPPIIAECMVNLECKLRHRIQVGEYDYLIGELLITHTEYDVAHGTKEIVWHSTPRLWTEGDPPIEPTPIPNIELSHEPKVQRVPRGPEAGAEWPLFFPSGTIVATCRGNDGSINILPAVGNSIMSWSPLTIGLAICQDYYNKDYFERWTYHLALESQEFICNIPHRDLWDAVLATGSVSARTGVDKFALTGLTSEPAARLETPMLQQCLINIECPARHVINLGSHDWFIGEAELIHTDEDLLTGRKRLVWEEFPVLREKA